MYEQHYGLQERPFELTPNPRFLFLSQRHREALVHLQYGLGGRPGITMIVGEAGTGKTTLVRAALASLKQASARVVHLSNPTLTRSEFYEFLAPGYGFDAAAGQSKTRFIRDLELALNHPANGVMALIVDEAQSLTHELLEEVRLLTNVQSVNDRSLTVILVGQPELAARLSEPNLRQLKQRITLRCDLRPFNLKETAEYVTTRVRMAGGNAEMLFTRDAIVAIHERSGGIPRTISVICDNALVNGFAADVKPVGRPIVMEVCRDFDLGESAASVAGREFAPLSPAVAPAPAPVPAAQPARPNAQTSRPADSRPMFSGFTRPRRFSFF